MDSVIHILNNITNAACLILADDDLIGASRIFKGRSVGSFPEQRMLRSLYLIAIAGMTVACETAQAIVVEEKENKAHENAMATPSLSRSSNSSYPLFPI